MKTTTEFSIVHEVDVFVAGGKICFILFVMDSFENQIITAIKKIRNANRRPDAEKIFKTITKESASNLTLDDVQQKLNEIQSTSQLRYTPYQGLDSYYIVQSDRGDEITSSDDILRTFFDETDIDCDWL